MCGGSVHGPHCALKGLFLSGFDTREHRGGPLQAEAAPPLAHQDATNALMVRSLAAAVGGLLWLTGRARSPESATWASASAGGAVTDSPSSGETGGTGSEKAKLGLLSRITLSVT